VVATVGRLVPRQALLYLREVGMALDLGEVRPDSADMRRYFRETLTTDEQGLTDRDRRYLQLFFPDRLVGLEALATMLGEDPTTVEQEIEPYLLRLKLIVRERTGRKLTEQGRTYVARQKTIRG
jgi:Holliday junction DNA helicase RuvB